VKFIFAIAFVAISTLSSQAKAIDSSRTDSSVCLSLKDSLVREAIEHLGTQYCRGGKSQKCFDCSGFVVTMYKEVGVSLPRTSQAQSRSGREIPKDSIKRGDIIYFKGRNRHRRSVGHVGIVVQNDGHSIIFIHASTSRGIVLEELEESAYYQLRYLGARRVLPQ